MAPSHLYEQISHNKRQSWFLFAAIGILFVLVGLGVGLHFGDPLVGLFLATAFALAYGAFSYFVGDKVVLLTLGAREVKAGEFPQLTNVVEEMTIAAGIPKPKVYVITSPASNALATGNSPEKASIAVTTGLLEILNREELQAVIGHEMAHIKNFDTRFAVLMAMMVGSILLFSDAMIRMHRRSRSRSKGDAIFAVIAIFLIALAPLAAKIIQFAMSRRRELLADNTSAVLTRNPGALANALSKIADDADPLDLNNRGTQHLFIMNPVKMISDHKQLKRGKKRKEKAGWFDTHPPLALRISLLREMAGPGS